jgi:hypothetical protein
MQLLIAVLNLGLVRIMRWQEDLERMPLIVREVFAVHSLFISIAAAGIWNPNPAFCGNYHDRWR